MEETAAERFLNALSAIIRNGKDNVPDSLELRKRLQSGVGFGDALAVAVESGLGSQISDFEKLYPGQARTQKSFGSLTRKLSVRESQSSGQHWRTFFA